MSSQFVQRLANYLANEVLVKGLANSKAFQRMALRAHNSIESTRKAGRETMNAAMDELEKEVMRNASSSATSGPPVPPLRGVPGFFSALGKEIRKDFAGGQ
mmetsp:Transcript_7595/g.13142  ORF Transcript_7595/g.13142 Transcript_7595/m.13142 type:complete len:101 (-) Transcript_7595:1312-1614(-)